MGGKPRFTGSSTPTNWDFISAYKALHSGYSPVPDARNSHYNRNSFNKEVTFDYARENWILMDDKHSLYHRMGPGNESNLKFVSSDGHSEAVFRPDGTLVTSPVNRGTYNNFSPYEYFGVPHFFNDILPYWMWGNSQNDPTNIAERVFGAYMGN